MEQSKRKKYTGQNLSGVSNKNSHRERKQCTCAGVFAHFRANSRHLSPALVVRPQNQNQWQFHGSVAHFLLRKLVIMKRSNIASRLLSRYLLQWNELEINLCLGDYPTSPTKYTIHKCDDTYFLKISIPFPTTHSSKTTNTCFFFCYFPSFHWNLIFCVYPREETSDLQAQDQLLRGHY